MSRNLIPPTESEDAAINAGIAADPDSPELGDEFFARAAVARPRGRPRIDRPKVLLTLRVDADVLDAFKASGPGWQTRMNEALRRTVEAGGLKDG